MELFLTYIVSLYIEETLRRIYPLRLILSLSMSYRMSIRDMPAILIVGIDADYEQSYFDFAAPSAVGFIR